MVTLRLQDQQPSGSPNVATATRNAARAASIVGSALPFERAGWLRAVADRLDAEAPLLATTADEETALGMPRLTGEIARTTSQLRMFAAVLEDGGFLEVVIDHATPDALPPRPDLRRMLVPLGPVAVFGASNFPFAFSVAGGDTASALAAGCPVVVKAHPGHTETSRATGRAVMEALTAQGAPYGTFEVVEGFEAGKELVSDPEIMAVGFTGSLAGGRALFDLAVGRPDPIPFYGELGSLNPVVLTEQAVAARAEDLASGLVGSVTLGTGQFCTKPGVVFIPAGSGFETAVAAAVGDASPAAMLHADIAQRFAEGLGSLTASTHVEVVAGDPAAAVQGNRATPVILATTVEAVLAETDRLLTECFGPTTLLVSYRDVQELLTALREFPGSLTATVHAEADEHPRLEPVFRELSRLAGRVIHGGWPTGVAVTWAQHHGGPWPATTAPLHTSVGATAIRRFLRPIAYQDTPSDLLPDALREDNPLQLPRRVDGRLEA